MPACRLATALPDRLADGDDTHALAVVSSPTGKRAAPLLALVAGALLWSRPATVAACKPPAFVVERLEFELVGARRGGRAVPLASLPTRLIAHSDPYVGLLVDDLGLLQLVAATGSLPRSTERHLQRRRRRARLICAVRVRHAPALPGRYLHVTHPGDVDLKDPPWTELWPVDVPGTVELDPTRDHLRLRIDRPDAPLELDYRLTHATFSRCDVTTGAPPDACMAIVLLLLRRRRTASRGTGRDLDPRP